MREEKTGKPEKWKVNFGRGMSFFFSVSFCTPKSQPSTNISIRIYFFVSLTVEVSPLFATNHKINESPFFTLFLEILIVVIGPR